MYKMVSDYELRNFRGFMRSGIPLHEFGPGGAYDSKPRGRDQGEEGETPSYLDAMLALKRKMSPEGFRALCMALLDDDVAEDLDSDCRVPNGAMDSREYHKRFPDAGRVVAYPSELPKPVRRSAAAAQRYAEMFPDAGRIRGA